MQPTCTHLARLACGSVCAVQPPFLWLAPEPTRAILNVCTCIGAIPGGWPQNSVADFLPRPGKSQSQPSAEKSIRDPGVSDLAVTLRDLEVGKTIRRRYLLLGRAESRNVLQSFGRYLLVCHDETS